MKEIRLLKADEIECRIGTIKANGCSLLLYKDARVDMKILDETFGLGNWQRTHEVINGDLYCTIEIWNNEIKQWIKKQDVGTESFSEKEKGRASDSFKRAGFNVGIGRELYTAPFIWITPKDDKEFISDGTRYITKTTFKVKEIGYDKENRINKLVIVDNRNNTRFSLATPEEQDDRLDLMSKIQNLSIEKDIDLEEIKTKFKVDSLSDMTTEQMKKCIVAMERKQNE